MPTILVATDLSLKGNNAAHYAAAMAQQRDCDLLMLHTYYMPVTFNDTAMPMMPLPDMHDAAGERLSSALEKVKAAFPGLNVMARSEYGTIEDTLEEVIEEVKPELLVIGTDNDEEDSFWSGSTSADLLRNTQTPILAVPAGYAYKAMQHVCMAVDEGGVREDESLTALQAFLKMMNAVLHIVHVATPNDTGKPIAIPSMGGEQQVILHPEKTAGGVDDAIADYVAANGMDCLVVIPHHYSFWESLFHKSHTKALLHKIHVPVLALH